MDASRIDQLVDDSLAGSRSVYAHHVQDPDAYVAGLRERFLARRIRPQERTVVVEPHVARSLSIETEEIAVYFVTDDDPQSVFFDPSTQSFGAAWGPSRDTGAYIDLGFRGNDVLEMASA